MFMIYNISETQIDDDVDKDKITVISVYHFTVLCTTYLVYLAANLDINDVSAV